MKVKWGVIGAGGIADRKTISGLIKARNAKLEAVMDINMGLARSIKEKYGAERAYNNLQIFLDDENIDAVYIASPPKFHHEQALAAARSKRHILLEKPMSLSLNNSQEIINICQENGVKLAVGFMMRFSSYHRKIKEIISSEKLGQIVSARAQLTCWYPEMANDWRQDPDKSAGGALIDLGIHCLDLLEFIIGSRIEKISAFIKTMTFNYRIEDSSAILFEMKNGCTGYIDNNFNIPDEAAKCLLEIYGTAGSIIARGTIGQTDGGEVDLYLTKEEMKYDAFQKRNEVEPEKIKINPGNMYTREIESFSKSILKGSSVKIPGKDGLRAQRLCCLAYEAARKGTVLRTNHIN